MIFKRKKKNEEDVFDLEGLSELEEMVKKREKKVRLILNYPKIVVTIVEIVLVIYFILALLGIVPFF